MIDKRECPTIGRSWVVNMRKDEKVGSLGMISLPGIWPKSAKKDELHTY
jgi:hypothetical protein